MKHVFVTKEKKHARPIVHLVEVKDDIHSKQSHLSDYIMEGCVVTHNERRSWLFFSVSSLVFFILLAIAHSYHSFSTNELRQIEIYA